jgi:uncharacterized protein (DUF2237 family)
LVSVKEESRELREPVALVEKLSTPPPVAGLQDDEDSTRMTVRAVRTDEARFAGVAPEVTQLETRDMQQ